jgi:hypothetical protein
MFVIYPSFHLTMMLVTTDCLRVLGLITTTNSRDGATHASEYSKLDGNQQLQYKYQEYVIYQHFKLLRCILYTLHWLAS